MIVPLPPPPKSDPGQKPTKILPPPGPPLNGILHQTLVYPDTHREDLMPPIIAAVLLGFPF